MSEVPSLERIRTLLAPYANAEVSPEGRLGALALDRALLERLQMYLELLLRWNERVSLTAVREPEQIVTRHFGESLLLSRLVPKGTATMLDLGSGAGFPGVPMQVAHPDMHVVLAECQSKKAAFLREVARRLCPQAEVWGGRGEELVGQRTFDLVALRAVDRMERAVELAGKLGRARLVLAAEADIERWGLVVRAQMTVPGSTAASVAALCE